MSEKLQLIITYSTTAVSVIAILFSIIKGIINRKNNTNTEGTLKLNEIVSQIPEIISEAETLYGGGMGLAKLNYVLQKIQIKCITQQVEYNEKEIKNKIEEVLTAPQKKKGEWYGIETHNKSAHGWKNIQTDCSTNKNNKYQPNKHEGRDKIVMGVMKTIKMLEEGNEQTFQEINFLKKQVEQLQKTIAIITKRI